MRCCVFGIVLLIGCANAEQAPVVATVPRSATVIAAPVDPRPSLPVVAEPDVDDAGEGIPDIEDESVEDDDRRFEGEKPGMIDHQIIDLSDDCHVEIVVRPDRDDDGVPDGDDRCPDEPEDEDGWEDDDGCPDPDSDRQEIIDVDDRCPDNPEDYDGYDDDGCPEPASAVL